ncbi:hypothetical protein [Streptomyces jumonjinensis]|uniref:hypothetical protein n=1 Tax=Streptomyces jumonjinensis TaxID=1945 RepID=UPI00379940D2
MVTDKNIGARVRAADGRVGILRAVLADYRDPATIYPVVEGERVPGVPTAFVGPEGGGVEWTALPADLEVVARGVAA